jgi:hypothetical protein
MSKKQKTQMYASGGSVRSSKDSEYYKDRGGTAGRSSPFAGESARYTDPNHRPDLPKGWSYDSDGYARPPKIRQAQNPNKRPDKK